jgi:hypothetical protein
VDEGITINEHSPIVSIGLEYAARQREERERAEQEADRLHAEMMSELDGIDWIREGF